MSKPSGGWRLFWMMLAILWTLMIFAYGWLNLPRARHVPHDPEFLSKLSTQAESILRGSEIASRPSRGALVWSNDPRILRMSNGTRLIFPAVTTNARAELVANEYHQLLHAEATEQRVPYLLALLIVWLVPLLAIGFALQMIRYSHDARRVATRTAPDAAWQPAGEQRNAGGERVHDDAPADPA